MEQYKDLEIYLVKAMGFDQKLHPDKEIDLLNKLLSDYIVSDQNRHPLLEQERALSLDAPIYYTLYELDYRRLHDTPRSG